MFSKREREFENRDLPEEKRFRMNLSELFLDNGISADRALSLFEDAKAAGAQHVSDLGKPKPYKGKSKFRKNAARDLKRRLFKKSLWPDLYYADVRVWDKNTQEIATVVCPMLLPHEVLECFITQNGLPAMLESKGMAATSKAHMLKMQHMFGVTASVGLGLWIDGAPCNWDRSESLECICISFCGLLGKNKNLRVPLCVIPRRFVVKHCTFEDILIVVSWSFIHMANGVHPARRHNGASFQQGEKRRAALAGAKLQTNSFLLEMRGDWKMFQEILRVPAWNTKTGCCSKCNVKVDGIRDFSSTASWRQPAHRLSHWQFLNRVHEQGGTTSQLFQCPGFSTGCIKFDWLHVMDLGVTADFLGNLFWMLLPMQEGETKASQISALFKKMKQFFQLNKVENQLKDLTEKMLRKKASVSPKLRASAAEARALVPFAAQEALASLNDNILDHGAAKQAAAHLAHCYNMLSHAEYCKQTLESHSIKFCLLYKSLEDSAKASNKPLWGVKPKMHLFQEICMLDENPADTWTYRDEDFGGYLAHASRQRGGKATVNSICSTVLTKFRAKFLPKLK